MQVQTDMTVSWLGILVIAGLITAIIAAVKHPAVRPWLLAAIVFVAVVVFLRFLAMPASTVVRHLENGEQRMTYQGASRIKAVSFGAVLLPLLIGSAVFASRRRHGHAAFWLLVPAALGLFLLGFTWTRARLETISPPVAVEHLSEWPATPTFPAAPGPMPGEEPVDELWMRINDPRIQLALKPDQPAEPAATAPPAPEPPVAKAPLQAEAESSWDDDSTHEEVAHTDATEATEAAATTAADEAQAQRDRAIDAVREATEASEASADPPPEWVGKTPRMVGDVYRAPVEAGPYSTLQECHTHLREHLRRVVNDRLVELVWEATGQPHVHIPSVEYLNIGNSFIDRELLTDQYVQETISPSVGPMKTAWALLEFTPQQDQQLIDAWKRYAAAKGSPKPRWRPAWCSCCWAACSRS